jgi:hypothetical protein
MKSVEVIKTQNPVERRIISGPSVEPSFFIEVELSVRKHQPALPTHTTLLSKYGQNK